MNVPDSQSGPRVSLVMPCLNEEAAVGTVIRKGILGLDAVGMPYEVLVIDNGSTDRSAEIARAAGARVVYESNRGYGNAYKRGFAEARGEFIIMADADDTYPVDNLQPFFDLLLNGYDMVNGDRFGGPMIAGAMTWSHRYIGTPLLSWVLRWFSGAKLSDSQCGMRVFRKSAIASLDLRAPGMEFASEMLVKAARAGLRLGQVPISLMPRVGESKLQTLPDGWRHLRYLLVSSPDHLYVLPGIGLLVLTLATLMLQVLAGQGTMIAGVLWQPRYLALVLGTAGVQVLWLGRLSKIYGAAVTNQDIPRFHLERGLALGSAILAFGLLAEVGLGTHRFLLLPLRPIMDTLGALGILLGLQTFFGSFTAYLLTSEYTRPVTNVLPFRRPTIGTEPNSDVEAAA
ncbi:MAG: glycosyltransferase [Chloroflexota bacterium]